MRLWDRQGRLVQDYPDHASTVSDIAWSRTLGWRRSIAELWPGVAQARRLRVEGPLASALLLQGWLRARLDSDVELEHVARDEEVESVAVEICHAHRGIESTAR